MHVIDNDLVCMFDVDDTLILWDRECHLPAKDRIELEDPYDKHTLYLKPHERHIKLLRQMHGRGRMIGVWSGGGVLWAKAVVEALGLSSYVHLVMTKPMCYVDDLTSDKWLNNHIYLKPYEESTNE